MTTLQVKIPNNFLSYFGDNKKNEIDHLSFIKVGLEYLQDIEDKKVVKKMQEEDKNGKIKWTPFESIKKELGV